MFGGTVPTPPPSQIGSISGPNAFAIDVVGESFYQDALSTICGGKTSAGHNKVAVAILIHEDDNPEHAMAIRVDIDGMTVGHLDRKNAREFRQMMTQAGHAGRTIVCNAKVVGGWHRGERGSGYFGVKLDLPYSP